MTTAGYSLFYSSTSYKNTEVKIVQVVKKLLQIRRSNTIVMQHIPVISDTNYKSMFIGINMKCRNIYSNKIISTSRYARQTSAPPLSQLI